MWLEALRAAHGDREDGRPAEYQMDRHVFEALKNILKELGAPGMLADDWILCMDIQVLRQVRTKAGRMKWLKKAEAEIVDEAIQERVDEIADAAERGDDVMVEVLLEPFSKDLERHGLSARQHKLWVQKAEMAAQRQKTLDDWSELTDASG